MIRQLRRALVESYVGAVALGYLLALDIVRFVSIFTTPVAEWASRRDLRNVLPQSVGFEAFPFRSALPQLIAFLVLLVLWYVLFRWLYFKPFQEAATVAPEAKPISHSH